MYVNEYGYNNTHAYAQIVHEVSVELHVHVHVHVYMYIHMCTCHPEVLETHKHWLSAVEWGGKECLLEMNKPLQS